MPDCVVMKVAEGIADVRFNRADKLSALDTDQFAAIVGVIAEIETRKDIRCVVLSGEGRAFCVGLDLSALSERSGPDESAFGDLVPRSHGDANLFQQAAWG